MNWALIAIDRDALMRNGPGIAASVLLHGFALLVVLFWLRQTAVDPDAQLRTVLIDIVHLGDETTAPPAPVRSSAPTSRAFARKAPVAHSPETRVSPHAAKPVDDLENRLNALAKLQAPETDTRALTGPGTTRDATATGDGAPGSGTYALKDFLRAQIERRWNLDLAELGPARVVVALRVVMKRSGAIASADIVDKQRYATDQAFRRIALSAKNAVLLASPIALPAGDYPPETVVTLLLDPREVVR
ncbi:MAG TPA: hypothetical protein VG889_22330 [Rhizomicrobium sp.]|nr:hypothetical protein [Rhizomicrobium sp.]